MTLKQYRDNPDLLELITDLKKRVATLETGRRLGSSSIDNGTLIVRNGDVSVRDSNDNERAALTHGSDPSLVFRAGEASDGVTARSVAFASGGTTSYQNYILRNSNGLVDGGKLLLTKEYAYLSHQPQGAEETFIGLSAYTAYPNHFLFRGKWIMDDQFSSWNALYMGTAVVGAGFGSLVWNYDYPYTTTPLVMYSITGALPNFNHALTASTTTSFTIGWSDALAHNINFQVWRR